MSIPFVVIVCVLAGKWKCGRAVLLFEILSFRDSISGVVSLLTRPQPVPSARCRGSCPAGIRPLLPTSAWGWRDATSRPSQVIQILAFLLLLCLLGEFVQSPAVHPSRL